jgi:hypothetical protein
VRHQLLQLIPAALVCIAAQAQPQEPRVEVASIKPGTPPPQPGPREEFHGGPGTADPGMFTCNNCELNTLIHLAYGPLSPGQFQVSNSLDSLLRCRGKGSIRRHQAGVSNDAARSSCRTLQSSNAS